MSLDSSNTTSTFYNAVYKSRHIMLELLKEQGYKIEDYHGFSTGELHTMINNKQMDMLLTNQNESKPKVYVKYWNILFKSIKVPQIQTMIDDLYFVDAILEKKDILFIITNDNPNDTIINEIKKIWEQDGIYIIIYSMKRLQFNILNHEFVPKHTILSEEEKNDFLKKYNITDNKKQIPQISRFDPVAQAIFMKPGDVTKIIRPSKTAITGIYYRYCINN